MNRVKATIDSQEIELIVANGNYTKIYFSTGRRWVVYQTLSSLESQLPSELFVRVHRSYLVNKSMVEERRGEFLVLQSRHKLVSIGKKYKKAVFELFS
jgi:DNA-binding LytR/AlgR family response regulator